MAKSQENGTPAAQTASQNAQNKKVVVPTVVLDGKLVPDASDPKTGVER